MDFDNRLANLIDWLKINGFLIGRLAKQGDLLCTQIMNQTIVLRMCPIEQTLSELEKLVNEYKTRKVN